MQDSMGSSANAYQRDCQFLSEVGHGGAAGPNTALRNGKDVPRTSGVRKSQRLSMPLNRNRKAFGSRRAQADS